MAGSKGWARVHKSEKTHNLTAPGTRIGANQRGDYGLFVDVKHKGRYTCLYFLDGVLRAEGIGNTQDEAFRDANHRWEKVQP